VIDVNTGRFVGKRDQEETILRNNLEAAREIAYQVKLRGIGGIIIVDFIDMEREKNRDKVYHALVDAMSSDKARTRISRVSDLGLIEISRERVREDSAAFVVRALPLLRRSRVHQVADVGGLRNFP
jgi:ribonuclease G